MRKGSARPPVPAAPTASGPAPRRPTRSSAPCARTPRSAAASSCTCATAASPTSRATPIHRSRGAVCARREPPPTTGDRQPSGTSRAVPAPVRHDVGADPARARHGHGGRASEASTRRALGRPRRGRHAAATNDGASPTSAAPRSTTRRTTSSRSCSPRSAPSRSRTRPAYDTPPRSPVWGPASVGAAPRPSNRICRTATAS